MSLKKIEQIKVEKPFKIFDLIIYGCVILIIVALLLVFFFNKGEKIKGVTVNYNGVAVFSYDFEKDENIVLDSSKISVEQNNENNLLVRFFLNEDKTAYNVIEINKAECKIKVIDTDCSLRKDCYHTAAISNDNGFITCTPHKLDILPYGYKKGQDNGIIPVG